MSGTRVQHLERRCGIFYLRVRVPDGIRSLVGLTEVRRSLLTYAPFRGRTLSAVYAARVLRVFAMVKTNSNELTKADVRELRASCFHDLAAKRTELGDLRRWSPNKKGGPIDSVPGGGS